MTGRQRILLVLLALGVVAMGWFVASDNGLPLAQMAGYGLFGLLLVLVAILSLRKERAGALGLSRWLKYAFGSFALAFALWMLGSVILLPFVGYAGFELMDRHWFGVAFVGLALLLFPITRRYLR
jgi:amino acid transporter